MKFIFKLPLSWLLIGMAAFVFGCSKDSAQTATLQVRLIDAPGDFEEVNIDLQDVQVNSDSTGGWKSLVDIKKGVYNLLEFTSGTDTLLGSIVLPVGKVSQIRLILGSNNTVKISGQSMPLSTPSAQQSGLKIQVHTTLIAGIINKITLDFDAARSIVSTGSGAFILKPVIRTIVEAESGAIKGMVTPTASTPAVYAFSSKDTATTSADPLTGKFLLKGLTAGSYTVEFTPKTGYLADTVKNVNVTVGSVTDMGTIQIKQ